MIPWRNLAGATGLEPATSSVTGGRESNDSNAIQLLSQEKRGCKSRDSTSGPRKVESQNEADFTPARDGHPTLFTLLGITPEREAEPPSPPRRPSWFDRMRARALAWLRNRVKPPCPHCGASDWRRLHGDAWRMTVCGACGRRA